MKKLDIQKAKETLKAKADGAKTYCKLHRSEVLGAATAFVGALASTIFLTKKLGKGDNDTGTNERRRWQDDDDFEAATISYGEEDISGAWFTTEKGGRIFFAEDENGNLP